MKEFSQQIESHMVVLNEDNLATTTLAEMQGATQPTLNMAPLFASKAPLYLTGWSNICVLNPIEFT